MVFAFPQPLSESIFPCHLPCLISMASGFPRVAWLRWHKCVPLPHPLLLGHKAGWTLVPVSWRVSRGQQLFCLIGSLFQVTLPGSLMWVVETGLEVSLSTLNSVLPFHVPVMLVYSVSLSPPGEPLFQLFVWELKKGAVIQQLLEGTSY